MANDCSRRSYTMPLNEGYEICIYNTKLASAAVSPDALMDHFQRKSSTLFAAPSTVTAAAAAIVMNSSLGWCG